MKAAKDYLCILCGEKEPSRFYVNQKQKCRCCRNKESAERLRSYKKKLIEYKGGRCSICGYSRSQSALVFHHINPEEKDLDYDKMKNWSFDKRKDEIDKCILVCANCHSEIHDKLSGIT